MWGFMSSDVGLTYFNNDSLVGYIHTQIYHQLVVLNMVILSRSVLRKDLLSGQAVNDFRVDWTS